MSDSNKIIPNAFPLIIFEDLRKRFQSFNFYVGICESTLNLFVNSNPENLIKVKNNLFRFPNNDEIWNRAFETFNAAFKDAPKPNLQIALFALAFNWDYFINNIGKFIFIASHFYDQITFHKYLLNLHVGGFKEQLSKIRKSTKIDFRFNSNDFNNSVEFFEVRHLGVHNGWTVDDNYLKFSPYREKYIKNEFRIFTVEEMEIWTRSLLTIAKTISETLADTFTDTYSFPGTV